MLNKEVGNYNIDDFFFKTTLINFIVGFSVIHLI